MKKAAIILSVIALIAISCGQAKKKQTETIAEETYSNGQLTDTKKF